MSEGFFFFSARNIKPSLDLFFCFSSSLRTLPDYISTMSLQEPETANKENQVIEPPNFQDRAHFVTTAKDDHPEVEEVEHIERVTGFVLALTSCVCLSGFLFGRS